MNAHALARDVWLSRTMLSPVPALVDAINKYLDVVEAAT